MAKVLVTGGTGFIGSHIVDELCRLGYRVSVVDVNLKLTKQGKWVSLSGHINKSANYYDIDIRNYADVFSVIISINPEYIIHCAAKARIQPSLWYPIETYETNVLGTLNLLEASWQFKIKKFIYSASSSVYGNNAKMPLKENAKTRPLNPYAYSKRMAEMLIEQYVKNFGLKACSLRYFNVYGPRQPEQGEYATVVGIFLRQLKNGKPFTIVPDGRQRRDFTYVSDVVGANILAMESDKVGNGEVINIGSGKNYSIVEIADIIGGKDYPRKEIAPRVGEAKETLADISKAKKLLSWQPEISFEKGIEILKEQMH